MALTYKPKQHQQPNPRQPLPTAKHPSTAWRLVQPLEPRGKSKLQALVHDILPSATAVFSYLSLSLLFFCFVVVCFLFFTRGGCVSHVYVGAWALGCFHSHISTQTFRRALTALVDSCAEILKECPFSGVTKSGRFGGRCRKAMLGVWGKFLLTPDLGCRASLTACGKLQALFFLLHPFSNYRHNSGSRKTVG